MLFLNVLEIHGDVEPVEILDHPTNAGRHFVAHMDHGDGGPLLHRQGRKFRQIGFCDFFGIGIRLIHGREVVTLQTDGSFAGPGGEGNEEA